MKKDLIITPLGSSDKNDEVKIFCWLGTTGGEAQLEEAD
jgi:hypothetical protein